jgi:hypothetical protein
MGRAETIGPPLLNYKGGKMIGAFPKIMSFGHKTVRDIVDGPVEVTEKLDGSQFAFAKIRGELVCRSKGKIINLNYPDSLFVEGVEYVQRIKDELEDGFVYYCEYLKKPKHNTLKYNTIPRNHLMLFGVSAVSNDEFLSDYGDLSYFANAIDIDVAPLIYYGEMTDDPLAHLHVLLDQQSYLGGPKIEGVVIKNYAKPYLLADRYLPLMSAKFVSEEFKEVHSATWKKDHTNKGGLDNLKERYCSEARWLKAVFHLRESSLLLDEPKDIGNIIKLVRDDIIEEEKESIKDALWGLFGKEILGAATKGLPEWYKERLVREAYPTENGTT